MPAMLLWMKVEYNLFLIVILNIIIYFLLYFEGVINYEDKYLNLVSHLYFILRLLNFLLIPLEKSLLIKLK